MSAPNQNWTKWFLSSISDHFDQNRGALPIFVEGQHRDTRLEEEFFELRVDGPVYREISKNYWKCRLEVNSLIQTVMDDSDFFRHVKNVGLVSAIYTAIDVYKYGDGGALLGCLNLLGEDLIVTNFGQIDMTKKLQQTTIEGHYEIHLGVS